MGFYHIAIDGIGSHHNTNNVNDADRMAEQFVLQLRAAGHRVTAASFTSGSAQSVLSQGPEPPRSAGTSGSAGSGGAGA